ncbi:unnamed protein product [Adineta steineri]|uniref:Uncharacterized protein n=1 Tax=Adineta steineri TaxID=433720 RepID=A0A815Q8U6_9BILA|nr:unnamed protein product [Adineta steineri]CAF3779254.1 unnamed protein product [Adineta steineri]
MYPNDPVKLSFIICIVLVNGDSDKDYGEAIAYKQQLGKDLSMSDLESCIELDNDYSSRTSPSFKASENDSETETDTDEQVIQIINFICDANLDKSNTNQLLTLLNSIHSNIGLPKNKP